MRIRRVVGPIALMVAVHASTPFGAPVAGALPTGFTVSPRVAVASAPVHAQGGGCTSAVQLVVTGFLFPAGPAILLDETIVPDVAGNWAFDFPMPSMPAYVAATCDGGSTQPIVIAPSDVNAGTMTYSGLTATEVLISTSPLVDGSELAVYSLAGTLLGSSVAAGGSATVTLPRTLGPSTVLVVGLRQQDPGIALPYVPFSRLLQLPLAASSELQVTPRVTAPGSSITVSGRCAGTPRVVIAGRPAGWYDAPPVYADVVALPPNGPFSFTTPMPVLPSTVRLSCTSSTVSEIVTQLISPATGDLVVLFPTAVTGGYTVVVPDVVSPQLLAAFGPAGEPVPLTVIATSPDVVVRIEPAPGMDVVIVGLEFLGENAEAVQVERVQGWSVDIPGASATTTTTTAPPNPSTSTVAGTAAPEPPAPPSTSAPTAGGVSGVLPPTGVTTLAPLAAAGACVLVGLIAVGFARSRPRRGTAE